MISVRRPLTRRPARLTAALLATGLAAAGTLAGAGAASAQDGPPAPGGATATLGGLTIKDTAIVKKQGGGTQELGAGLFEMAVDNGGSIQTYCVDFGNPTMKNAKYQEVPWSASSLHNNENAGKIRWILQNSYPQINDLAALAKTAGTETLTENTAAAGTQVAIWRFSDKVNVEAKNPAAEKLADYLESSAQSTEEPKASLGLSPAAVSGKAGSKLGPITVNTDAQSATVSVTPPGGAAGVKLVDKNGQAVTTAANGTELFVDVPAGQEPGTATVTAQATTKVPVGRAFAGMGEHAKSQTQILAGSSESTVTATATATWANQGPIPALSAEKNCAKGGVDVTAKNEGDEAFPFELAGEKHTVEPGESKTVTVPVKEDQAYKITIKGPEGFEETFEGVLDCSTEGGGDDETDKPSPAPSPAGGGSGDDLANTGSSSSTPMIAGIAAGLVVVGGATLFLLRKRNGSSS
jgi:TQXA domain-containing protein/LPXTG-motif cell wall-anchored protein